MFQLSYKMCICYVLEPRMISKAHQMASIEEANIDGQNENKSSRLLQPEHESVEVKYMVMPFHDFLPFPIVLYLTNTALKHRRNNFESFWVV